MRLPIYSLALPIVLVADVASAATIVIYTDPMTLSRRTVIYNTRGRDRAFLCMAPPSEAGCTAIPIKRR